MHRVLKNINRNVVYPVMELLFIGYITCIREIVGYQIYIRIMTAAMLLSFVLFMAYRFSEKSRIDSYHIKMLIVLTLYLIIRLISFVQNKYDESILMSIILEVYYLVVVVNMDSGGFRRMTHAYRLFALSSVYQALNLIVFLNFEHFPIEVKKWFWSNTLIKDHPTAAISTNPNAAGIFCAITMIVALVCFMENKQVRVRIIAFSTGIFQIICFLILYTDVRSAEVSMLAAVFLLLTGAVFKRFQGKKVVSGTLTFAILILIAMGIFYSQNKYNQMEPLSEQEIQLNTVSANRYIIWKTCFITSDKSNVFGRGSLKLEKKYRKHYAEEHENIVTTVHVTAARYAPHSGYIEILTVTGWLGFTLLMIYMYLAINGAKHLNEGFWYILLCFILINNLFEGLLILDRFFPCFYLFRELSVKDSPDESIQ